LPELEGCLPKFPSRHLSPIWRMQMRTLFENLT
jgi:hypothetical protein